MRFIFGLIAGALAALLVATALDAPTGEVLQHARQSWQAISAAFSPQAAAPAPQPTTSAPRAAAGPDAFVPEPMVDLAGANTLVTPSTPELNAQPAATAMMPDIPAGKAPTLAPPIDAPPAPAAGEAVVWSPFHSEASATGFANRLSRQLSHPFEVRRQGPANYVVVYSFDTQSQHMALQEQISQITGVSSS